MENAGKNRRLEWKRMTASSPADSRIRAKIQSWVGRLAEKPVNTPHPLESQGVEDVDGCHHEVKGPDPASQGIAFAFRDRQRQEAHQAGDDHRADLDDGMEEKVVLTGTPPQKDPHAEKENRLLPQGQHLLAGIDVDSNAHILIMYRTKQDCTSPPSFPVSFAVLLSR